MGQYQKTEKSSFREVMGNINLKDKKKGEGKNETSKEFSKDQDSLTHCTFMASMPTIKV